MSKKSPTGCRADQLFGLWLIAPEQLEAYRAQAVLFDLNALAQSNAEAEAEAREPAKAGDKPKEEPKPAYINEGGVAVIDISGPTTKYPTSFSRVMGGTSTMMVERALTQAVADKDVSAVLMHFDSAPGGTVAGAFELVDRIYAAKASGKPIWAHISDQGTSAAYLFASACDQITANRNAVVGSIGTRAQLVDTSEKLKRDGIKVIPIAAGKYKAAGMDGTPITNDQIKDFQRQIEAMNDQFIADVVRGRPNLTKEKVRAMEARCYIGNEALAKGLIDGVGSYEDLVTGMKQQRTASGASGIPGITTKPAAPLIERSVRMDLLNEIRELFGAAEMSEEQAVAKVRSLKTDSARVAALAGENDRLKTENEALAKFKPKEPDMEALRDRADLTEGRIDVAVAKQELPPVLATKLKGLVMKDGKPNPFWLTTVTGIEARPIDAVLGMFAGEKLGGPATGSQTNVQDGKVLDREVPGANDENAKLAKIGEEQGKAFADSLLAQQRR